eukprot:m.151289 g.151289  ORF g.151289 m.151289 type:complete len:67 (-) comp14288_c0_seq3:114-314(-)
MGWFMEGIRHAASQIKDMRMEAGVRPRTRNRKSGPSQYTRVYLYKMVEQADMDDSIFSPLRVATAT